MLDASAKGQIYFYAKKKKLLNKGKAKLAHLFGVNLQVVWNIDKQPKPEN